MVAAERADSHWTYISEIENGHRNVGISVLRRTAVRLGVSLFALLAEAESASDRHES